MLCRLWWCGLVVRVLFIVGIMLLVLVSADGEKLAVRLREVTMDLTPTLSLLVEFIWWLSAIAVVAQCAGHLATWVIMMLFLVIFS